VTRQKDSSALQLKKRKSFRILHGTEENPERQFIKIGPPEKPEWEEFFSEVYFEGQKTQLQFRKWFMLMEIFLIVLFFIVTLGLIISNAFGITNLSNSVLITLIGVFGPVFLIARTLLN